MFAFITAVYLFLHQDLVVLLRYVIPSIDEIVNRVAKVSASFPEELRSKLNN